MSAQLHAAAILVDMVIRRDVFTPEAPTWSRTPYAGDFAELLPCAWHELGRGTFERSPRVGRASPWE